MPTDVPVTMVADWPVVSLADVTTKIGSGATPRGGSESYLAERSKFALVRSQNVFDRRFDESGLAYVTDEQADALRGATLQPEDVVLNITGDGVTFGRACLVPHEVLPACVNQHVSIVRADHQRAVPGYLLSFLTHPDVKPYIASFNSGGSRRAVTKGHIESFRLPLPAIEEQRGIAATLGALDDKIESIRRQIAIANALADELWEIIAVAASTSVSIDELTAAGSLQLSDGYRTRVDQLGEPGVPILRVADVADDHFAIRPDADHVRDTYRSKYREKVSVAGDVLVTTKGTVGRTALVGPDDVSAVYSPQLCFVRTLDREKLPPAALHRWVRSHYFRSQAQQVQHQTDMAAYVSLADFRRFRLPFVDPYAKELADIAALDLLIAARRQEATTLGSTRDVLLPELLSGRIRVPEAREVAESAL